MTDSEKILFKNQLKAKALQILNDRIGHSSSSMNEAQEAANSEDKSTVGDKHETSRSMALIDRELHARQLDAARKDLLYAQQTDVDSLHKVISPGSFFETSAGKYFLLTGLGSIDTAYGNIFYLSVNSPIGKAFHGKKTGDRLLFNGKEYIIESVF
jgi:transcription elongation GreA/GreB family factor